VLNRKKRTGTGRKKDTINSRQEKESFERSRRVCSFAQRKERDLAGMPNIKKHHAPPGQKRGGGSAKKKKKEKNSSLVFGRKSTVQGEACRPAQRKGRSRQYKKQLAQPKKKKAEKDILEAGKKKKGRAIQLRTRKLNPM